MVSKYVGYFRVSTDRQGKSGLGLDAQKAAVSSYLASKPHTLISFTEVESGKHSDRPELAKALAECRRKRATLIVAKLDRLSRNAEFLKTVVKESGERGVVFCDLPTIPEGPQGKFVIAMMAEVAELEAGMISQRTRAALAQSKKKLGGRRRLANGEEWHVGRVQHLGQAPALLARQRKARQRRDDILPVIQEQRAKGLSLSAIASYLNAEEIPTARGGQWSLQNVGWLLAKAA